MSNNEVIRNIVSECTLFPFISQTIRGEAGLHAGHGTEQVNLTVCVERVPLRQSNARRRREINEPLIPRSDAGQLVGHNWSICLRGHSKSFVNGFSPSTKKEDSLDWLRSTRLRVPLGGVLRSCASIVPQSYGVRAPWNALVESIENNSCRANSECSGKNRSDNSTLCVLLKK